MQVFWDLSEVDQNRIIANLIFLRDKKKQSLQNSTKSPSPSILKTPKAPKKEVRDSSDSESDFSDEIVTCIVRKIEFEENSPHKKKK